MPQYTRSRTPEMNDEDLFAELEAEIQNDDDAATRERGMQQLREEMERLKALKDSGHGRYDEIMDEKLVLQATISEPLCIIHFYLPNFRRCTIMDKHLTRLAPKYFSTRFVRVSVENVPFLVDKLAVKVLPAVYCFIKGVAKSRIVGFEELGNTDNFDTSVLESRLLSTGVIKHENNPGVCDVTYTASSSVRTHIRGGESRSNDDFDFDL